MRQGDVEGFMGDDDDALVVAELLEPAGIDGEVDAVGPRGFAGGVVESLG